MLAKITAAVLAFIYSLFGINSPKNIVRPQVSPTPVANITVSSPGQNEKIGYIIRITGQARVFENQFQWRLKDGAGTVLVSGTSMSDASDSGQFGNYLITSGYPPPTTESGLVEVYDSSAKDGAEMDLVSVPILFPSGPMSEFNIYLGQYSEKSSMEPCQTVIPVKRFVPKTTAIAKAALEQLLSGPTTTEAQKYYTSINPGVTINKLTIGQGIATVDFSDELERNVGGSCKVTHIRSQITATLKQFPTVKQVIISISGRTDDILQP